MRLATHLQDWPTYLYEIHPLERVERVRLEDVKYRDDVLVSEMSKQFDFAERP